MVVIFLKALSYWRTDTISTGNIIYIISSFFNIAFTIEQVSDELTCMFSEVSKLSEGLKLIRSGDKFKTKKGYKEINVSDGKIEFKEVLFKYSRNDYIFNQSYLIINSGSKVALVGRSGSGKTTFAGLILRLYDIDKGNILIDGEDIKNASAESLSKNIALIPQETVLFHRTIMENIKYGNMDCTDEEVRVVAEKSYCHKFIEQLPQKYDTIIGERGNLLSMGQKQRISIARAMLKNTRIIIMDEFTSSLDNLTTQYVRSALEFLTKDKTTIIISHKLHDMESFDRILVFDEGNIVEDGDHKSLLEQKRLYYSLYNSQFER